MVRRTIEESRARIAAAMEGAARRKGADYQGDELGLVREWILLGREFIAISTEVSAVPPDGLGLRDADFVTALEVIDAVVAAVAEGAAEAGGLETPSGQTSTKPN